MGHTYSVDEMVPAPRGTVTKIEVVGPEKMLEIHEMLVVFRVRNHGRTEIQLVCAAVEAWAANGKLQVIEIKSDPLPSVLDPLASLEIKFQKEVIDLFDGIIFVGVIDALGRRHGLKINEAKELIQESWNLPTRVERVVKKGENESDRDPFRTFQVKDEMNLLTRSLSRRAPRPIMNRTQEHSYTPSLDFAEEGKPCEPKKPENEN